jgi:tRNA/rRNA methyltransferase
MRVAIRGNMNSFHVYMFKCSDGPYYVGHTDNQDFGIRDEAFVAERKIKKWSRKKKEALIEKDWQLVSLLAQKNFSK